MQNIRIFNLLISQHLGQYLHFIKVAKINKTFGLCIILSNFMFSAGAKPGGGNHGEAGTGGEAESSLE